MKEKPGSDQGLSFRRLATMDGAKRKAPAEIAPKKVQESGGVDLQSDETRRSLYRMATKYMSGVMSAVREDKSFSLEPGRAILERIVDIRSPKDALFLKAIHSDESYDFVVNHSVNVAIYGIKMAETLAYTRKRIIEMGMVGLFHDIGMAKIPEEIIYKKDKLNDREFHLIMERPKLGYEILRRFGEDYDYLAECALQIYERVDGSGYPRGIKEDEINEYAQIIGLVDVYEALIHSRPQRERILHYYAVKEIIRSGKRQFQQKHLKTLLNTFSIFPLHSYVKLNSNAIGRVIQTYLDQPMRPNLQIVCDSQRKRVLTERIINLPEHSLLYITDAVSEEELLAISEESYLLTKSAGYDASEPYQDKAEKSDTPEKVGAPVKTTTAADHPVGGATVTASGGKRRTAILVIAVVLIAVGGLWQFMTSNNADMETPPAVVENYRAKVPGVESRQPEPSTVASDSVERPGADQGEKAAAASEPVREQNLTPASPAVSVVEATNAPPVPQAVFETSGPPVAAYPFSIKLTYFRQFAKVQKAISTYRASGIQAYWVKVDLGDRGIWYRVFGGYFRTPDDAEALLEQNGLSGAVVKETVFANWIGASEDAAIVQEKVKEVSESGFSPYVIEREDGKYHLYVGAFYTKAGAEELYRDLEVKNIMNKIVER